MPGGPIDLLLRVREVAKDEAMRLLAIRLNEEVAARRLVRAAETRLSEERLIATDPAQGDGVVEAYIAWLPVGRGQERAARDLCDRATANVTIARAEVRIAHAAADAAVKFQEHQLKAARMMADRKAQHGLDEVAARLTRPR